VYSCVPHVNRGNTLESWHTVCLIFGRGAKIDRGQRLHELRINSERSYIKNVSICAKWADKIHGACTTYSYLEFLLMAKDYFCFKILGVHCTSEVNKKNLVNPCQHGYPTNIVMCALYIYHLSGLKLEPMGLH